MFSSTLRWWDQHPWVAGVVLVVALAVLIIARRREP